MTTTALGRRVTHLEALSAAQPPDDGMVERPACPAYGEALAASYKDERSPEELAAIREAWCRPQRVPKERGCFSVAAYEQLATAIMSALPLVSKHRRAKAADRRPNTGPCSAETARWAAPG